MSPGKLKNYDLYRKICLVFGHALCHRGKGFKEKYGVLNMTETTSMFKINYIRLVSIIFAVFIVSYFLLFYPASVHGKNDIKCKTNLWKLSSYINRHYDRNGHFPEQLLTLYDYLTDDPRNAPKIFKCANSIDRSRILDYDIILTSDRNNYDQEIIIYEASLNHYRRQSFFGIAPYNARYVLIVNPKNDKIISIRLYDNKEFEKLLLKYHLNFSSVSIDNFIKGR
ncbi:MAG: hypothetical protein AB1599_07335 [Planctomycetota bacterium]